MAHRWRHSEPCRWEHRGLRTSTFSHWHWVGWGKFIQWFCGHPSDHPMTRAPMLLVLMGAFGPGGIVLHKGWVGWGCLRVYSC